MSKTQKDGTNSRFYRWLARRLPWQLAWYATVRLAAVSSWDFPPYLPEVPLEGYTVADALARWQYIYEKVPRESRIAYWYNRLIGKRKPQSDTLIKRVEDYLSQDE